MDGFGQGDLAQAAAHGEQTQTAASKSRRRIIALTVGLMGPGLAALASMPAATEAASKKKKKKQSCRSGYYYDPATRRCEPIPEGGCFLTTACAGELRLPDDCFELRSLRAFRDGPLSSAERGGELVKLYYELAPVVLQRLPGENRPAILRAFYARYVIPSVICTTLGLNGLAKTIYMAGSLKLVKLFAPEELERRREQLISAFGDRARRALG